MIVKFDVALLRRTLPRSVFRSEIPCADSLVNAHELRERAANSHSEPERNSALLDLHDIDSLSFVADNTGYLSTRLRAISSLESRLRTFSDPMLMHLSENSGSATLRECAKKIRRQG
jgi:hypothetical protein